jgi:hypothetical protein
MEQKQMEQGIEPDRLLPPADPARPRSTIPKNKPLWNDKQAPSPLFQSSSPSTSSSNSSSSGFDKAWDTTGFRNDSTFSSTENSNKSNNETKSSWKFW